MVSIHLSMPDDFKKHVENMKKVADSLNISFSRCAALLFSDIDLIKVNPKSNLAKYVQWKADQKKKLPEFIKN